MSSAELDNRTRTFTILVKNGDDVVELMTIEWNGSEQKFLPPEVWRFMGNRSVGTGFASLDLNKVFGKIDQSLFNSINSYLESAVFESQDKKLAGIIGKLGMESSIHILYKDESQGDNHTSDGPTSSEGSNTSKAPPGSVFTNLLGQIHDAVAGSQLTEHP